MQSSAAASPWDQQFPTRLLSSSLEFVGIKELLSAIAVCQNWRLLSKNGDLLNRLIQLQYLKDFEQETADDKRIAVDGPESSWLVRYKRRKQTEVNWKHGIHRQTSTVVQFNPCFISAAGPRYLALRSSQVSIFDSQSKQIVSTLAKKVSIARAALTSDGKQLYLASGMGNDPLKAYSLPDLKETATFNLPNDSKQAPAYAFLQSDGNHLVAGLGKPISRIAVWDLNNDSQLTMFKTAGLLFLTCDFANNKLYGLDHGEHGSVLHSYDLSTGQCHSGDGQQVFVGYTADQRPAFSLFVAPTNTLFAMHSLTISAVEIAPKTGPPDRVEPVRIKDHLKLNASISHCPTLTGDKSRVVSTHTHQGFEDHSQINVFNPGKLADRVVIKMKSTAWGPVLSPLSLHCVTNGAPSKPGKNVCVTTLDFTPELPQQSVVAPEPKLEKSSCIIT